MAGKRIESEISRTAEWTCLSRALSTFEADSCYRSGDQVAVRLLPDSFRLMVKIPLIRRYFSRVVPPKGMYEYVIARTKYIDAVFEDALKRKFDQILLFGAGFDTRALRFQDMSLDTRIFELDTAITQQAKLGQYKKRGLDLPQNVTFIQIDFDKESPAVKLEEAGFKRRRKSLFVLEGLLMYLQPESVDQTFRVIQDFAGVGSRVVFDFVYASVIRKEQIYEGEKEIVKSVTDAGEQWQFGIEKGKVGAFLKRYDMKLCEQADAGRLEQMFFTDSSGKVVGRVNGTHCLALAEKV